MERRTLDDTGYYGRESCDLEVFKALTARELVADDAPRASEIVRNVPVYDMAALAGMLDDAGQRAALMAEWARVLRHSAGVIALRRACPDPAVIDRASAVFRAVIEDERAGAAGKGDHFAASGANDRIWNALQKQCLRDPEGFALYFGNPAIAAACEAWLGPDYQVTAQVNQVRPGGKAQNPHRDYHLGFQSAALAARYPAHAHEVTATLTLQGAIAHCDMPLESGPTKLLPFSQLYAPGYLGFHEPAHAAHFEAAHVQLPLEKGDAVFFNPALFHAAGENRSADIHRMANLLQISSAFGRAMEAIDRQAMCAALFPALVRLQQGGRLTGPALDASIAACAEGYSFPTNLDTDPPVGGNAPESQADLMRRALAQGWTEAQFTEALAGMAARQAA